jgi:hypothetical protein
MDDMEIGEDAPCLLVGVDDETVGGVFDDEDYEWFQR